MLGSYEENVIILDIKKFDELLLKVPIDEKSKVKSVN